MKEKKNHESMFLFLHLVFRSSYVTQSFVTKPKVYRMT